MQTILVANPKGGSGKTTLATNIAGWLAGKRQRVVLLRSRPAALGDASGSRGGRRCFRAIAGLARRRRAQGRRRRPSPQWLVVDTPAGLHGDELRDAVRRADVMLVPLTPSVFDMAATRAFPRRDRRTTRRSRRARSRIGIVAMRVDARTRSAAELDAFLTGFELPLVTHLRDTQVYVHCARDGAIGVRPAALARRAGLGAVAAADALDRAPRGADVRPNGFPPR